jgi:hypothetical protein
VPGRREAEGAAGAGAAAAEDVGGHEVVAVPPAPAGDEAVPRSPRGAGAEAIPGGGADLQARARGRAAGPDAGSC